MEGTRIMIEEHLHTAHEELKRVDHLVYVSLKYTRTCDIFKSIVERLIASIDPLITALLEKLERKGKLEEIPEQAGARCALIKQHIKDEKITEMLDFYMTLRRINRAPFERSREFRRHVTMTCSVEGEGITIDIDTITADYKKTKVYLEHVATLLK